MPARTNPFQKLVAQLQRSLGSDTIVESPLFEDRAAGVPREVDIVVYKPALGRETHVAIECVDLKGRADVQWVEQQLGKHRDIPTQQLVLVSSNGFTEGARRKAEYYGVTLLEPRPDPQWAEEVLRRVQDLYLSCVGVIPERYTLFVATESGEKAVSAAPDFGLYDANGGELGALFDFVASLLGTQEMQRFLVLGAKSHPEAGWFQLGSQAPQPSATLVKTEAIERLGSEPLFENIAAGRLFLRNDELGLERVVAINIVGRFTCRQGPAKLKMGLLDGQRAIWGTATLGNEPVMVAVVGQNMELHASTSSIKKRR